MKFQAYKYGSKEDKEGEITLVFKVSKSEAHKVLDIPVETLLDIEITPNG